MKRILIAAAILLFTFAAMLCHSFYISAFTDDLSAILETAEARAEEGDWTSARELTHTAREKWEAKDAYLHILLRHNETDNIDTQFREVAEFIQCEEGGEYSAANARLIAGLDLLSEAEQLTLRNVL